MNRKEDMDELMQKGWEEVKKEQKIIGSNKTNI